MAVNDKKRKQSKPPEDPQGTKSAFEGLPDFEILRKAVTGAGSLKEEPKILSPIDTKASPGKQPEGKDEKENK